MVAPAPRCLRARSCQARQKICEATDILAHTRVLQGRHVSVPQLHGDNRPRIAAPPLAHYVDL